MRELAKAYEPGSIEQRWFDFWEQSGYFHGEPNPDKPAYSIVIPPPNVTGILTLGHVLNNTLQDILCRYRRMRGYEVCWFPGTDHAGIATESRVEKFLRTEENLTRDELGREEFINRVWQWKEQYGGTIIRQLRTLGCSCDWERERFTMDEGLSAAVRKVFVELYNKGYIYRGVRMINYCPVAKSALSDEEVIYKDVSGKFYHISYPLADGSAQLIVATTRPETLFGDTAVAVHPDDERYKNLIGKMVKLPLTDREIPIIADEHADPTKGTGCVKITPGHDPNDFAVGERHNLPIINIFHSDASMNDSVPQAYRKLDRFEARKVVVRDLEAAGLMVKIEDISHAVGYSERGDVPIETIVSRQWFCKMGELAKPAVEAVRSGQIKFYPERWSNTYYHWMDNIQDWCISRQIWWGHRIPAWYNDETGEVYVAEEAPTAPGNWRQEEDVLDTWFSSWLWPFSIMGWPQDTAELKYFYPSGDLVTGPDIIFFWVARMIMAGCEFMDDIPFKNVYFTSIIRDDIGRKLSKSLGNSPDPLDVIATYGADALRFSIVYIAPVGMDIRYSNDKCEIGRNFANKLWNACRFRQMQGEVSADFADVAKLDLSALTADEKWLLVKLEEITLSINKALEEFKFHTAAHDLYELVWSDFCDWYIEAAKAPLRAGGEDKERALRVLDYALWKILRLLHPFMPFITEELAHQMGFIADDTTIMYADYPQAGEVVLTEELLKVAELTDGKNRLVTAGRSLRASSNIPDGKKVKYYIKSANETYNAFLNTELNSLVRLLNAEAVEVSLADFDVEANGMAPSLLEAGGTIYLPLAGLVDLDEERRKLEKQRDDLAKWINASKSKLCNEKFLAKAPEKVVREAQDYLADLESKAARVAELLAAMN